MDPAPPLVPTTSEFTSGDGPTRVASAQSIAFAYAHTGPEILGEDAPLDVQAPSGWGAVARAVAANDEAVMGASNVVGAVLRYGQ